MSTGILPPSQLWVCPDKGTARMSASVYVQKQLCKNNNEHVASCTCISCKHISDGIHQHVTFIRPEKNYTLTDIDIIFKTTRFQLEKDECHFFILEHTERLTSTCANKLLKVIEEPPPGYHFIFITNNAHMLLPTIRSRCVEVTLTAAQTAKPLPPILSLILDSHSRLDPKRYMLEIKKYDGTPSESIELLSKLSKHVWEKVRSCHVNDKSNTQACRYYTQLLKYCVEQLKNPPNLGSFELFWKNMYLASPRAQ